MKDSKLLSNKSILFFSLIVAGLSFLFEYHQIIFLLPQSVHDWRQMDCASFAMMYYENGMHFFEPKVHHLLMGGGHAVGEFPILYYIVACLYKLFGAHEIIFRVVFLIIFYAGLFSLFKLVFRLTRDLFFSYFVPVLFFSSPLIMFFANNFLCDVPSISMTLIAWNFILKYRDNQKEKYFWWSMFFFAFAGLLKLNSIISFVALAAMFFIELTDWIRLNNGSRLFINVKNNLLGFFLVMVVVGSWYFWAINYNEQHHTEFLGTKSWPGWPVWEASTNDFLTSLNYYFWHLPHIFSVITCGVLFFLLFFVIANRTWLDPFIFGLYLLILSGVTMFVFTFFVGVRDNIYYIVNLMILPLFILISSILIFKNKYPIIFTSFFFRGILTAFLFLNVFHAKGMLKEYYHEGTMHYHTNLSFYKPEFKTFIDSIGIKKHDKVISIPDVCPNRTLYLMGRTGWSEYGAKVDTSSISNRIKMGGAYLIINDRTYLGNQAIMNYTGNFVASFDNVYVYRLPKGGNYDPSFLYGKFRVSESQFISFERNGSNRVFVSPDPASASNFYLIRINNDQFAIKTDDNKFVSCDIKGDGNLAASREWINDWETFKKIDLPENKFALQSIDGKYFSVSEKDGSGLVAISDKFENASLFQFYK